MGIKKYIPNSITCLNLVCGCIAIHFAYRGMLSYSGFAIFAAAIFDFSDGMVARLLHVKSELGKQLDSLSDVVSFGVAPFVIMSQLMIAGFKAWHFYMPEYLPVITLIIPVCAALRLAKFNIDKRQSDSFIGLPTPAVGLVIATLPILITRHYESPLCFFNSYVLFFVLHPAVLIISTLVFSFLMVSGLPLFGMKFNNWGWKQNKLRYIFIIVAVLLILLFYFVAIPIIVILYIVISFILYLASKKKLKT
jgi:CDP-diacylglycerol---serine O-phosphatidyltransferase